INAALWRTERIPQPDIFLFPGIFPKRKWWVRCAYPPYEPRDADAAMPPIRIKNHIHSSSFITRKKKPPRLGRLFSLPVIRS
ncbi:hypothetical protein ACMSZL_004244, partial [Cronobacter muytjensii]